MSDSQSSISLEPEEDNKQIILPLCNSDTTILTRKQTTPLQKQQRQFFDDVPVEAEETTDINEESTFDTSESEIKALEYKNKPILVKSERQIFKGKDNNGRENVKEQAFIFNSIEVWLDDAPTLYPTKKKLEKTTRFHPPPLHKSGSIQFFDEEDEEKENKL